MRISDWSSDVCSSDLADDDVGRLADIDARVRRTFHHAVLDQHVIDLHRIEAVGAVVGAWAPGPFGAHAAHHRVLGAVDLERVALGILKRAILEREIVAGDAQPLGARSLLRERQIGRASRGERVCEYVWISGVTEKLK